MQLHTGCGQQPRDVTENQPTPFLLSRVPFVRPWRTLNLGLDLQMT